jgi:hypothetical protein
MEQIQILSPPATCQSLLRQLLVCLSRSVLYYEETLTAEPGHTSDLPNSEITCPLVASTASSLELETLKTRIRELEGQLNMITSHSSVKTSLTTNSIESFPARSVESITTGLGGGFNILHDNLIPGEAQTVVRSVAHKNRVFGQSHWISSITLFRDVSITFNRKSVREG